MDIARLVLDFIDTLVWPAVVITGLLLFKKPFTTVILRLKGAGLPGGVTLNFEQELRDAQSLSRDVAKAPSKEPKPGVPTIAVTQANARLISLDLQPSPSGLDMAKYSELARQDPNIALAGLRMEIEILARNLAKGFKIDFDSRDSAGALLGKLQSNGAITEDQYYLAQKIVRLCNAAIHGTRVSQEDAEAVIDTAKVLAKDYLLWLSWGFDDNWKPQPTK